MVNGCAYFCGLLCCDLCGDACEVFFCKFRIFYLYKISFMGHTDAMVRWCMWFLVWVVGSRDLGAFYRDNVTASSVRAVLGAYLPHKVLASSTTPSSQTRMLSPHTSSSSASSSRASSPSTRSSVLSPSPSPMPPSTIGSASLLRPRSHWPVSQACTVDVPGYQMLDYLRPHHPLLSGYARCMLVSARKGMYGYQNVDERFLSHRPSHAVSPIPPQRPPALPPRQAFLCPNVFLSPRLSAKASVRDVQHAYALTLHAFLQLKKEELWYRMQLSHDAALLRQARPLSFASQRQKKRVHHLEHRQNEVACHHAAILRRLARIEPMLQIAEMCVLARGGRLPTVGENVRRTRVVKEQVAEHYRMQHRMSHGRSQRSRSQCERSRQRPQHRNETSI